ncbi:hypothetical protein EDB89DRAFT_1866142, partial [Lactarius sanguifluus]
LSASLSLNPPAQNDVIIHALQAPSPSTTAVLNAFIVEQETRPVWNGHPPVNHGIPVHLYHPSFARFLHVISDNTAINLKPGDYKAAQSFIHTSAVLYMDEARHVEATVVFLDQFLGRPIPALDIRGMRADGACQVVCGGLHAVVALKEDKNEIGTGGCDPSHQCVQSEIIVVAHCPTFLIALAGPWMCILGAVFVDHVVVKQLTDFVWIGGNPYNDKKLKSVTRILAALRTGIAELGDFYEELGLSLYDSHEDLQHFFPFIRQYSVGEHVVKFSYQGYLTLKTLEAPKAIFLATTETESPQKIVVKFVQSYNTEAHCLLASADCAPRLVYCSMDDPNPPELGGLTMVVMEYVNGKTAHQRYGNDQLLQLIFDQVEEGLEILHTNNIVFGDLRPLNIMITEDEHVLLINFDWCGTHEEQTYPVSLNDARDMTNRINWHPEVERGGIMKKEHDTFMLRGMKPRSLAT